MDLSPVFEVPFVADKAVFKVPASAQAILDLLVLVMSQSNLTQMFEFFS